MLLFWFARYLSRMILAFVCNSKICLVLANVMDGSFRTIRRCHYSGRSRLCEFRVLFRDGGAAIMRRYVYSHKRHSHTPFYTAVLDIEDLSGTTYRHQRLVWHYLSTSKACLALPIDIKGLSDSTYQHQMLVWLYLSTSESSLTLYINIGD